MIIINRSVALLLILCIGCMVLSMACYATDGFDSEDDALNPFSYSLDGVTVSVANDVNLSEDTLNAISESFANSFGDTNLDGYQLASRDVVPLSVSAPANPTTLKGWLLTLIGDYETIFTVETYTRYSGTTSSVQYVTDMSPDYPWVYSCLLFIVVMFSIFKLIGGYVCKL